MGPPTYYFLLVISTVFYPAVCFYFARHRASSWFHPLTIYLAFHGIAFVLRPWLSIIYQYDLIYRGYQFTPDWWAKCMALIVTNLGLAVFAFTILYFGDRKLMLPREDDERERYRFPFLVLVAVLAPFFVHAIQLGWNHRMDAQFTELDLQTGHRAMVGASGYATGLFNLAPFILGIFAWIFRFRLWALIVVALVLIPLQGIGTRAPTVYALFVIASLFLWDRRARWFDVRTVALTAIGFLMFSVVGADRGQAVRQLFIDDRTEVWRSDNLDAPLEGMDFGNLEMVEFLTNAVPRKTGTYEYFVDQLALLTEPIPRGLWPEKPRGQPIRLFNLFDYGTPWGMTRSLPGEGWTQLGLLGVVIWCGLWGFALGRIYNWFAAARKTPFVVTGYVLFLSLMIVCYRDGLLVSVFRFGLFTVGPVFLWRLLSRFRVADHGGAQPLKGRDPEPGKALIPRARRTNVETATPRAWRRRSQAVPD